MRKAYIIFALLWLSFGVVRPSLAQSDKIVLSITPPLIKNNVSPGQVWKSYVKVVNNNSTDMEAYVQVRDFEGGSESGTVQFISSDQDDGHLLSNWIVIEEDAVSIPAGKSVEVPFVVSVPEGAAPGGHYAAILVGNKPTENQDSGTTIKVSSQLASLILLSVDGEMDERGAIREFSTDRKFYFEPRVNFDVRFENLGNVHIQPQGEIRIYNWFGKDKGTLSINQKTDFGNVLPGGIRKWDFIWEKEDGFFEMGRYKADLILGYGNQGRQTINQTHYFWIINLDLLAIVLIPLFLFVAVIFLIVRIYVRSAIRRTQREFGIVPEEKVNKKTEVKAIKREVEESVQEVQTQSFKMSEWQIKIIAFLAAVILVGVVSYVLFSKKKITSDIPPIGNVKTDFSDRNKEEKSVLDNNKKNDTEATSSLPDLFESVAGQDVVSSTSMEIASSTSDSQASSTRKSSAVVDILNGSGTVGVAAFAADLVKDDYVIGKIDNADSYDYEATVIRYQKGFRGDAENIRKLISDKAKLEESQNQDSEIVIIIGKDFK